MRSHIVLGGGGFIGRHLARAYAGLGANTLVVDLSLPEAAIAAGVKGTLANVFTMGSRGLRDLIEPFDTIHHLVWSSVPASAEGSSEEDLKRNVGFTIRLIELLKGTQKRLVFSSSGGTVYGRNENSAIQESQPCRPVSAYGAGKASAEAYILAAAETYGLDARIARLSNPFGAGQSASNLQGAASRFISNAISQRPIEVWGDGSIVRDFIHIEDMVAGWVCLERVGPNDLAQNRIFNIGSGRGTSLKDLLATIATVVERDLPVRYSEDRTFDLPHNVLDVTLARSLLGWQPELSLLDGIRATVSDLIDNGEAFFAGRRPLPGEFAALRNSQPPSPQQSCLAI